MHKSCECTQNAFASLTDLHMHDFDKSTDTREYSQKNQYLHQADQTTKYTTPPNPEEGRLDPINSPLTLHNLVPTTHHPQSLLSFPSRKQLSNLHPLVDLWQ